MSLMRRNTTLGIDSLTEITYRGIEIKNILSSIFEDRDLEHTERVYTPLVNLHETDNKFIVELDVPSFTKNEIKVLLV